MSEAAVNSSLLQAISASPEDEGARQVYADWLDEQGRSGDAALIRAQCALGETPDLAGLATCVDLLPAQEPADHLGTLTYARGLPTRLELSARGRADARGMAVTMLGAPTPLEELSVLFDDRDDVRRFPRARRLNSHGLGQGVLQRLAASDWADVLRAVFCWRPRHLPLLPALEEVHCGVDRRPTPGREELAALGELAALRRLTVEAGADYELRHLPGVERLEQLRWTGVLLPADLRRLGPQLVDLDVRGDHLDAGELAAHWPDLPRLERLNLSFATRLGDDDMARLVEACPNLRSLSTGGWDALTPAGASRLGGLPLEALDLRRGGCDAPEVLRAIGETTAVRRLRLIGRERGMPIDAFAQLEVLGISGWRLDALERVALPSLRGLDLALGTEPSSLASIADSPIDRLGLPRMPAAGLLRELADFPDLRWLGLPTAPSEVQLGRIFDAVPQLLACWHEGEVWTRARRRSGGAWQRRIALPELLFHR